MLVGSTVIVVMVCARLLFVSLLGDANLEVGGRKRAAFHLSHAKLVVELEAAKVFDKRAPRQTRVEQRSQEHVPGNPREQIQVQDPPALARCFFPPNCHASILLDRPSVHHFRRQRGSNGGPDPAPINRTLCSE